MKFILLIILILILLEARHQAKYDKIFKNKQEKKTSIIFQQQENFFRQIVDHKNETDVRTFDQRYWVADDFYNQKNGSIFIYLCGDEECDGIPEFRLWIAVVAQQLNGLIITLQHRFYGNSLPFGQDSFKLSSMKFLSSQQALKDTAYFIQTIKKNNMHKVGNNPWIVFGGFYSGMLSARLREQYPNIVIGALASSAVVNYIEDFTQFDQQVYNSTLRSGNATFCPTALNNSIQKVQQILYKSQASALQFKLQFSGGQMLTNKQFSYFWADVIGSSIQYGARSFLCDDLMKGQSFNQQFQSLVRYAKFFEVYQYGSYYLKDQQFAYSTGSSDRPWFYQCCTQFGFFQTHSKKHPMRSFKLDLAFFKDLCVKSFGPGIWANAIKDNAKYTVADFKGSNIIFSNGIQDPWRWASLQKSDNANIITKVIDCKDCAHCADLHAPQQKDSTQLKQLRNLQFTQIKNWIKNYKFQTNENIRSIKNLFEQ